MADPDGRSDLTRARPRAVERSAAKTAAASWWVAVPALTLGLATPAVFAVLASTRRSRVLAAAAVVYAAVTAFALWATQQPDNSAADNAGGVVLIALMIAGTAHALIVARQQPRRPSAAEIAIARERENAKTRESLRRLVRTDPAAARRIGIGRPDRKGATHGGLVDLNHAPDTAIARLAEIAPEHAARIVELREELGGFGSVEDVGVAADLPPADVERLRDYAVFLPF